MNIKYRPIFSSLKSEPTSVSSLPVIVSPHVTPDSGTGLVHCAPAHGAEDYSVMQALGLVSTSATSSTASTPTPSPSPSNDLICHVNGLGQFTSNVAEVVGEEAASSLVAQDVLGDGSRAIVDLLKRVGALNKIQRFKHRYPYDWKTDKPVITLLVYTYAGHALLLTNSSVTELRRSGLRTWMASKETP